MREASFHGQGEDNLGPYFLNEGIEVDKARMDLIANLPLPIYMKDIRSFLGHVDFYRRFIKDISTVAKPLSSLLAKDTPFHFFKECELAFMKLKEALTTTPILHHPVWEESFELMCNASDYAVGVLSGQRINKKPHVIYYVSHTLQVSYTMTEKEFLAVGWGLKSLDPTSYDLMSLFSSTMLP